MSRRHLYTLYGHVVSVPFCCSQLTELPPGTVPDLVVEEGPVPRSLENPTWENNNQQAAHGRFLLRGGQRAGRFLVEDGGRVTLQRSPQGEDDRLSAHFITHVAAALMRSLGLVVLHANTVVMNGRGIALAGDSGSGKSTTQAALLNSGGMMVSDDVTVVRLQEGNRFEVLPGFPRMNLCQDAAIMLGREVEDLPRNPLRQTKVVAPHQGRMAQNAQPLHGLYLLGVGSGKQVQITKLSGKEKFTALLSCVYGPMHPNEHPPQFALFSTMADKLDVYKLVRPAEGWWLAEMTEKIIHG